MNNFVLTGIDLLNAVYFIALDGEIMLQDLEDKDDVVIALFSLFYTFNLQYPKSMESTFEILQRFVK